MGTTEFHVDAQLPRRLARWLERRGHVVLHTLQLPNANRTRDAALLAQANLDGAVLVTKDSDFRTSFERQNSRRQRDDTLDICKLSCKGE
jgi:predicted nuclease of predicted toxin-antitoxin system